MIDLSTYRSRIGCYNPGKCSNKKATFYGHMFNGQYFFSLNSRIRLKLPFKFYNTDPTLSVKAGYILCLYFILLFSLLSLNIISGINFQVFSRVLPSYISSYTNFGLPNLSTVHVRLSYFVFLSFVLNKYVRGLSPLSRITPANFFFGRVTSRVRQLIAALLLFILLLTFLMIAILNTSLINPGPQNLKIYNQNVQGLIPFSNLSSEHPILDRTKICELNSHIHIDKPDIVLLNETWLKKSIRDNEVIENPVYKIFRKDRTVLSHPADSTNPRRFRRNGGRDPI